MRDCLFGIVRGAGWSLVKKALLVGLMRKGLLNVVLLVMLAGCRHGMQNMMTYDEYMAVLTEDSKATLGPMTFVNDRDFRRLYYWHKEGGGTWSYGPLWVIAEVYDYPLGNRGVVDIDVKYVSAYKVSWFMCSMPPRIVLRDFTEDFSPDSRVTTRPLRRVPTCTGALFALKILPVRKPAKSEGPSKLGCIVSEAHLIESFHNKLLYKWIDDQELACP